MRRLLNKHKSELKPSCVNREQLRLKLRQKLSSLQLHKRPHKLQPRAKNYRKKLWLRSRNARLKRKDSLRRQLRSQPWPVRSMKNLKPKDYKPSKYNRRSSNPKPS
jgi:hypothetical protein